MRLRDMSLMSHPTRTIGKVRIVEGSPLELLKGTLDTLILKTLSRGPNHGYGIARWLRESSADAFQVEEGALYPALRRLEKRGLLASGWDVTETGREAKFYRLTEEGRAELHAALANWSRYVSAMGQVLDPGGHA
jgi:PadR family transcriptional regulator PadR